jgi:hypothetical protein
MLADSMFGDGLLSSDLHLQTVSSWDRRGRGSPESFKRALILFMST